MSETTYFWFEIISMVVLTGILLADVLIIFKRPHIPSAKESALWVSFYAALALIFGLILWLTVDALSLIHI
jgi:tellurite resistance protein TerC